MTESARGPGTGTPAADRRGRRGPHHALAALTGVGSRELPVRFPSVPYPLFDPIRVQHLEMIQSVISRLAGNAFLVKGWAITLSSAMIGFALSEDDWRLAAASGGPAVIMWILDAYFLRAERLFRQLHDSVRAGAATPSTLPAVEPFDMSATTKSFVRDIRAARPKASVTWPKAVFASTVWPLYGLLATLAAVVAVAISTADDKTAAPPSTTERASAQLPRRPGVCPDVEQCGAADPRRALIEFGGLPRG